MARSIAVTQTRRNLAQADRCTGAIHVSTTSQCFCTARPTFELRDHVGGSTRAAAGPITGTTARAATQCGRLEGLRRDGESAHVAANVAPGAHSTWWALNARGNCRQAGGPELRLHSELRGNAETKASGVCESSPGKAEEESRKPCACEGSGARSWTGGGLIHRKAGGLARDRLERREASEEVMRRMRWGLELHAGGEKVKSHAESSHDVETSLAAAQRGDAAEDGSICMSSGLVALIGCQHPARRSWMLPSAQMSWHVS